MSKFQQNYFWKDRRVNRRMEERWTEGWPERQTEGQTDPSVMDRRTEGRTRGWKDGQTLFYWTLLATARGPIINIFIIEQIQWQLKDKFFFKFKKTFFGTFLGVKKENQVVLHNFVRVFPSKIQRNLMMKFQENTQTNVRKEGWANPIS